MIENTQEEIIDSRLTRVQTVASKREPEILCRVVINRRTSQNYTFKQTVESYPIRTQNIVVCKMLTFGHTLQTIDVGPDVAPVVRYMNHGTLTHLPPQF